MPEIQLRGGEVDGLTLHYDRDGHGPAVVLVHGLGGFAASWAPTTAALVPRATVYALDLPGFGRSAKPRGRYGVGELARALGGFLDTLGLGSAALVGHSLGGAVALTYALTHPARVERLALIAAVVPGFAYRLSLAFRALTTPGLGEAMSLLGCAPLYRAALARCFHAPRRADVDFLVRCDYAERTGPAARAAYLAALRAARADFVQRGADYRRAIGTLDLPVLLIHGRQDPVVPPRHCADVADAVPDAAVRWVDACGHFPHLEHPATVNAWLADFVGGRRAPR